MKNRKYRRKAAVLLAVVMAVNLCMTAVTPLRNTYAYTERSATVYATSLNVRSGPGTGYPVVAKLTHGAAVTVVGEQNGADGVLWYQIRCIGTDGAAATGYVSGSFIRFTVEYKNDGNFEAYLTSQGFPESYKPGLRQLHAKYPNWIFTAQQTGLDWNTVIQNESLLGRNLVHRNSISSWKSTVDGAYNWDTSSWAGFDGSAWVAASEDIIRYYMDPRNFLDEMNVFQFLLQSYSSSSHTAEGLKLMVKGTFLDGNSTDGSGGSVNSPTTGGGAGPNIGSGGGTGSDMGSGGGSDSGYVSSGPGAYLSGGAGGSGSNQSSSNTGNTPAGNSSTGAGGSEISNQAPGSGSQGGASGGGNEKPSLEGPPQASLSRHETDVLASSYGPGVSGPGAVGPGDSQSAQPGTSAPSSGSSSYIDIIMNAGMQSGVNPYVLAAMIIQEQSASGTGSSISGTEPGYEGYYNFFNIEAYASNNMSAVTRGLWWASQPGSYGRPWNTVEKSIIGGAEYYGANYVKAGQDTFYLKKFNVQGSNLYKHQYMTNVQGAASEGAVYAKAYSDEMKQTALEFKIPVYNNMPDVPASKPVLDGSPNNKLSYLEVSGFSLTPTFNRDVLEYDLIVDPSVSSVTVNAALIDAAATVSGTGNIALQSGNNTIKITVKAQNGSLREYTLRVVRQNNGPTYTGGAGGSNGQPSGGGTSDPSQGQGPAGPGGPGTGQASGTDGNEGVSTPGGGDVTAVP